MRSAPLALLVLGALLSGCVKAPDDASGPFPVSEANGGVVPAEVWARVRDLMEDVPCEVEVGAGTSANLLKLGELDLGEGMNGEADLRGETLLVADEAQGGFAVVDVSDPTDLRLVATFLAENTSARDVKWLSDGAVVVGLAHGLQLVDASDPEAPVEMASYDFKDLGLKGQAHMVTPVVLDGKEWLYVATQAHNAPVHVFSRDGWSLTHESSFGFAPPLLDSGPLGNHDVTIVNDSMRGDAPTLYLA
ncbi:MAG TPA: hypothetical protein VHH36_05730, partial [Candidatus Thermoplasmatota archaeon]|nr:hypothetical protein [Candidatus Thermoplasmatota archaeon]